MPLPAASAAAWPTTSVAHMRRLQQYRAAAHALPPSLVRPTPTPPMPPSLGRHHHRRSTAIAAATSSSSPSSSLTLPPKRRPPSVTPARQRRRDRRAEEEGDGVDLRPGSPGFEQRFASAVRAARGPRALGRLLARRAYLRAAPAPGLAAAMAMAAGMASARVADEVVAAVQKAAALEAAARRRRRRPGRRGDEDEDEDGEQEQQQQHERPPRRDAAVVLLSGGGDGSSISSSSSSSTSPPFPLDGDQYPTLLAHCRALAAVCAAELRERLRLLPGGEAAAATRGAAAVPPPPPPPPPLPLLLSPLDQARAAHSLARLGLYDPELLDLLLERQPLFFFARSGSAAYSSSSSSSPLPPAALTGMAAALAAFSHAPPPGWLARWRLESFRAMGSFDAQQLASAAFALVRLSRLQDDDEDEEEERGDDERTGSPRPRGPGALAAAAPWLELASRAMRARWQEGRLSSGARARGAGRACHPQSLVRFAVALAEAAAPDAGGGGGESDGDDDADDDSGLLPSGPGALADLAPLRRQQDSSRDPHHQHSPPAPSPSPSSSSSFRPSFNWLAGLCAEARRGADALAPRELAALLWALARLCWSSSSSGVAGRREASSSSSFAPDSAFLATWCRAAAARMPAFDARSLSVAAEALAVVAGEQRGVGGGSASASAAPFEVPGRFASALLARSSPLLPRMRAERLAALLWALAALRVRPSAGWLLAWVDAFSPAARLFSSPAAEAGAAAGAPGQSSSSPPPPPLPANSLADVAWALARLRLDPGPAWLAALFDAAEAAVPTASAADLAALAWAAGALPGDGGRRDSGVGGEADGGRRAWGRPRRAWLAALGARARDAAHLAGSDGAGGGGRAPEAEEERRRVVDALAAFVADEVASAASAASAVAPAQQQQQQRQQQQRARGSRRERWDY